jgi:hypothetical protein
MGLIKATSLPYYPTVISSHRPPPRPPALRARRSGKAEVAVRVRKNRLAVNPAFAAFSPLRQTRQAEARGERQPAGYYIRVLQVAANFAENHAKHCVNMHSASPPPPLSPQAI